MAEDLIDTVGETVAFLRMVANQMRRVAATDEPGIAQQLHHMAAQCEVEAKELAERFGIDRYNQAKSPPP
jgi:hypothetical protein